MASRNFDEFPLSRGEKASMLAYATVAILCGSISFWMVNVLSDIDSMLHVPTTYEVWAICAGAIGAVAALYLCRGWMGQLGLHGVGQALIGAVLIGIVAAIVAGSLLLPVYGTMFGPFLLVSQFFVTPYMAGIWFAVMLVIHCMLAIGTFERETIFRAG